MATRVYTESENGDGDKSGGPRSGEGAVKKRRGTEFDRGSDFSGRRGRGARGSNEPFSGRRKNEGNDTNGGVSGGRGRGGFFGGRGKGRDSGGFRGNGQFKGKREGGNGRGRGKMAGGRGNSDGQGGLWVKKGGKEKESVISGTNDDDDDDDMVEEEGKVKGYKIFKQLVDNDDADDDMEEDVEEEDPVIKKVEAFVKLDQSTEGPSDSHLSSSRFEDCPISPLSLKAIKDVGFERMTMVQEATLNVILKGKDVLAKARTGTGKTVAFLLPSIELVVKSPPIGRGQNSPPIYVLVICPTRELASQAATEANTLLKYHPSIGVQVVIGGTNMGSEQKRMKTNPCQILVATPGRLMDHVQNTSGLATRLMGVKVLVLDEADQLLDMGFRKAIDKIIAAVPKQRQTLLFSATVPQEVREICRSALKSDHEFVNTVQEGSEDTHAQVRQAHLVAPLDKHFPLLYTMLKEHIAEDISYKILVFCTTAMGTKLVAKFLGLLKLNVREIHSRKNQSYRTKVSDEFRKSKGLILVTSDVSARGVDYPDVTLVIQIGAPSDKQQYIHRLGRTGRKGKEGQGILMLSPWEEYFLSSIRDLPISKAPEPLVDPDSRKKVECALSQVEMKNKEAAYQAWLGYYNSNKKIGKDKRRLVELANEFSRSIGLNTPPAIPNRVLGKMGLTNIPGLRSK